MVSRVVRKHQQTTAGFATLGDLLMGDPDQRPVEAEFGVEKVRLTTKCVEL